jgi:hypothetical protein
VFANVIGGNRGNGIRVQDSDNTIIHANDIGLGIDNQTPVGNVLDGTYIGGTSSMTQFGGIIPLGNVSSANGGNGVSIRDTASGTVVFNVFAGLAAFLPLTNLGNGANGILVTSTGGNNIIRTSVVSNNRGNGIEISGEATGVQVAEVIIGMNTDGMVAFPNGGNGVLIAGNAHDNAIGGFVRSIIPRNIISSNVGNGVAITGTAHNNIVANSFIGTIVDGRAAAGNNGSGILLGAGTFSNVIGGTDPTFRNLISGNLGNGISLINARGNFIGNNLIGTDASGQAPLINGGNGIYINAGSDNFIGGPAGDSRNIIAFNGGSGVLIASGSGNAVLGNAILGNLGGGITLAPGANNNQPAPVLTHIRRSRRVTGIGGKLRAAPNSTYRVEFFGTEGAGLTGSPQGQTLLGSTTLTTDARGVALIRFPVPTQTSTTVFTATATDAANNTSSFSDGVPVRLVKTRP